jgi:hypothetical protein
MEEVLYTTYITLVRDLFFKKATDSIGGIFVH